MTRKHFAALAAAIASIPNMETRVDVARKIGAVCRDANPRFDVLRFYDACSLPENIA